MSSEVMVLRLSTGEELIGTVDDIESTSGGTVYNMSDIAILIPAQSNSLGLAPFMPYTDITTKGVKFQEKDVMFATYPVEQLLQQYQNMFSKIMTQDGRIQV